MGREGLEKQGGRGLDRVRTGQPGRAPISFLTIEASPSRPLASKRPGPGSLARLGIPAPGGFPGSPSARWSP